MNFIRSVWAPLAVSFAVMAAAALIIHAIDEDDRRSVSRHIRCYSGPMLVFEGDSVGRVHIYDNDIRFIDSNERGVDAVSTACIVSERKK